MSGSGRAPGEPSVSDIRVVLLLLALCPAVGLAQPGEPVPPPPLVEVEDAPAVEAGMPPLEAEVLVPLEPAMQATRARRPVPAAGRVVVESLGGALAGVGGAFFGLLGAVVLEAGGSSCEGGHCKPSGLVTGLILGASLGTATGVAVSGSLLDGQGRLLPTLGMGLLTGGGAAALYATGVAGDSTIAILCVLPLITSIATYELTGAWFPAGARAQPASGAGTAWWTPTVGVSGRGATLGLTGRF